MVCLIVVGVISFRNSAGFFNIEGMYRMNDCSLGSYTNASV